MRALLPPELSRDAGNWRALSEQERREGVVEVVDSTAGQFQTLASSAAGLVNRSPQVTLADIARRIFWQWRRAPSSCTRIDLGRGAPYTVVAKEAIDEGGPVH